MRKTSKTDEDYEFQSDPKRKNYKKIKLEIKKSLIHEFYTESIPISILTKKYHLSYSTIAHILKVYKEKNRIFESKRLKEERQIDQSIQREAQIKEEIKQKNSYENVKIQTCPFLTYNYYPFWTPFMC